MTRSPRQHIRRNRQISLAVFRLMIHSNFIGCSTGRSAGLATVKILSSGHHHGDTGKDRELTGPRIDTMLIREGCCSLLDNDISPRTGEGGTFATSASTISMKRNASCFVRCLNKFSSISEFLPNRKSAIENLKCHLMTRSARASTFGGIFRF